MVFLSNPSSSFWDSKASNLKAEGLAGIITSEISDFEKAVDFGLAIIYDIGDSSSSESLDFTDCLSNLPIIKSLNSQEYLSGILLPPSSSYDELHPEITGEENEDDDKVVLLEKPKEPFDKIPIIQSTETIAGSGRLGKTCRVISGRGYTSCLLKHEVTPKSQRSELSKLSTFWTLALQSLSRKTSENFSGFRSKVAIGLRDDVPMQWFNYQKSIMDDGSLGQSEGGGGGEGDPLDTEGGDYLGF